MIQATTTDVATTVDAHLAALTETDPGRRIALIEQAWADRGRYVDPLHDVTGQLALDELAAALAVDYAGHTHRRTSGIDLQHDLVRYSYELVAPDGSIVVVGTSFARLASDGRLQEVTDFFGELPAHEADWAEYGPRRPVDLGGRVGLFPVRLAMAHRPADQGVPRRDRSGGSISSSGDSAA